jgi:hypothetical protein
MLSLARLLLKHMSLNFNNELRYSSVPPEGTTRRVPQMTSTLQFGDWLVALQSSVNEIGFGYSHSAEYQWTQLILNSRERTTLHPVQIASTGERR